MVNIKNVIALRDFVRDAKVSFDMSSCNVSLNKGCGTAGCIAGHAALLWPDCRGYDQGYSPENTTEDDVTIRYSFHQGRVAAKLGMSEREVVDEDDIDEDDGSEAFRELIMPPNYDQPVDESPYTKDRAVAVLTHLAETGEVDWDKFLE